MGIEENGHRATVASAGGQKEWSEAVLQLLKACQGTTLMDVIAFSDIDYYNLPKPICIERLGREFNCLPVDMVFFDNSKTNIKSTSGMGVLSQLCEGGLTWNHFVHCAELFDQTRRGNAR